VLQRGCITWIIDIQIHRDHIALLVNLDQIVNRHPPGPFTFGAVMPPTDTISKFLKLDRLGLGIVLAPSGQGLFVIPDSLRRPRTVEEEQVGGNTGVGGKDAVGQAHDSVQVEVPEQLRFDAGGHAVGKERAIGDDDGGAGETDGRDLTPNPSPNWRGGSAFSPPLRSGEGAGGEVHEVSGATCA